MRLRALVILDLFLIAAGSLGALALRNNYEIPQAQFYPFLPYLGASLAAVLVIFALAGVNRTIWRFSSFYDYLRLKLALAGSIGAAVLVTFALSRLEGIARSLPVLQFLTSAPLLVGARALHRLNYELRDYRKAARLFQTVPAEDDADTILIVGLSKLSEAYLRAAHEFMPGNVKVAGLLGRAGRHVGRLFAACPILGVPEELSAVLDTLEVHGVLPDRIVVTQNFSALSELARNELVLAERERHIELLFLGEEWGLGGKSRKQRFACPSAGSNVQAFDFSEARLRAIGGRRYWCLKRAIDIAGSFLALILLSPLIFAAACLAVTDLGFPIIFRQQRPGLGGTPFQLYKFRTMRSAHARNGKRLTDEERASKLGHWLRRLRLDELPQLYNILVGDMSFIGPRPLLPKDQPSSCRARLLVRPGLTGWAQVQGGRAVTPADKAALDVWYVLNASLFLDLKIALQTVLVVLFGERLSRRAVSRAWQDLRRNDIVATPRVNSNNPDLHSIEYQYR